MTNINAESIIQEISKRTAYFLETKIKEVIRKIVREEIEASKTVVTNIVNNVYDRESYIPFTRTKDGKLGVQAYTEDCKFKFSTSECYPAPLKPKQIDWTKMPKGCVVNTPKGLLLNEVLQQS